MKIIKSTYLLLFTIAVFFSCSTDSVTAPEETDNEVAMEDEGTTNENTDGTNSSQPNILLIIADDMGLDASPGYNLGTTQPNMPNLQNMINSGLTFTNVWSYPTCTPTRASMITGKYGFRTNVLKVDDPLSTTETAIQKYITENSTASYSNAVIGKWHLSRDNDHPQMMGVDYFAGFKSGGVQDYSDWTLLENGTTSNSTTYTTTKFTDLAIDWVSNQDTPWFLWLAYNAPHTPFHLPPTNLHSQGSLPTDQASIDANPLPYYMASLEAMDTEIGRLLNSMSDEERANTIIIFVGDNGTPNQVRQYYPNRRVKGTVYQGGVNVPMVVSGANINRMGETEEALVGTVDIFATVADIADTGITELHDSKSFKSLFSSSNADERATVYTEVGNDAGTSDRTIRNATHKYILFSDGSEALYDLSEDALEETNLLASNQLLLSAADEQQHDALIAALNTLTN